MGTVGSTSQSPVGPESGQAAEGRQQTKVAGRALRSARGTAHRPRRRAGGSQLLARDQPGWSWGRRGRLAGRPGAASPRVRRFPPAGRPARASAARAGKKSAAVETVTTPSFELVQTWLSAPPRPSGPGTPKRRFPPSAASAPSRPPAGSRHPAQPAFPPAVWGFGLRRPFFPERRPHRLPERRRAFGEKNKEPARRFHSGGSVPQRLPARAHAPPARPGRVPRAPLRGAGSAPQRPAGPVIGREPASRPANRGGAWLDRGGQIKAMAIGLPGLALGPGASDTHWDAEGGGAPAAAAAVARGSGARERRGLGRGAQVTRRCRAGRPAGRRGSGARRGAAAAGHLRCRSAGPGNPPPTPTSGLSRGASGARGGEKRPPLTPLGKGCGPGPIRATPAGGLCGSQRNPRREPGRAPSGGFAGGGGPLARPFLPRRRGRAGGARVPGAGRPPEPPVSFVWSGTAAGAPGWDGTHTS